MQWFHFRCRKKMKELTLYFELITCTWTWIWPSNPSWSFIRIVCFDLKTVFKFPFNPRSNWSCSTLHNLAHGLSALKRHHWDGQSVVQLIHLNSIKCPNAWGNSPVSNALQKANRFRASQISRGMLFHLETFARKKGILLGPIKWHYLMAETQSIGVKPTICSPQHSWGCPEPNSNAIG